MEIAEIGVDFWTGGEVNELLPVWDGLSGTF